MRLWPSALKIRPALAMSAIFNERACTVFPTASSLSLFHPTLPSRMVAPGVKVKLSPARPSGLPQMYEMTPPHPKRSVRPEGEGRTYYYLQDISCIGMTAALQTEVNTPILYGSKEEAIAAGTYLAGLLWVHLL
jgi:hypothetical protein